MSITSISSAPAFQRQERFPTDSESYNLSWSYEQLRNRCDEINKPSGYRGILYKQLITEILQVFDKKNSVKSVMHLSIVRDFIPENVKNRDFIQDRIFDCYQAFFPYLVQRLELENADNKLEICLLVDGLKTIDTALVAKKNQPLADEVKKNIGLFNKKLLLFASLEACSSEKLTHWCDEINKSRGYRGILYEQLIKKILEVFDKKNSVKSVMHLSIVRNFIPENVKNRGYIQGKLLECYQAFFPYLEESLQKESLDNKNKIRNFITNLTTIDINLIKGKDKKLANAVEKCIELSHKKLSLSFFLKKCSRPGASFSEMDGTAPLKQREIYPILSIDGGGIRGIIPAKVLVAFESFTNKPISQLFKMVGGTSTGGILALGCAKPDPKNPAIAHYKANDLLNFYRQNHEDIFQKNSKLTESNYLEKSAQQNYIARGYERVFLYPTYDTPKLFGDMLGNTGIQSALTDVVVTANTVESVGEKLLSTGFSTLTGAYSFLSVLVGHSPTAIYSHSSIPKKIYLFTNNGLKNFSYEKYDRVQRRSFSHIAPYIRAPAIRLESKENYSMDYVAKVTSAAPSYFLPQPITLPPLSDGLGDRKKLLVDGGVLQNNPAIPCIYEALDRYKKIENLFMVSLGTGQASNATELPLNDLIASLWFETTQPSFIEQQHLGKLLPFGGYHRFQYNFQGSAPELDSCDAISIQALEDAGDHLVAENEGYIREICKVLDPESG